MQISPNFFVKGQADKMKDMQYCKQNNIDTSGMNYQQTKGAIVSNMTDGKLGAGFATNKGPLDRMKDLMLMAELGLEPTGSREGNKAAILNVMA